MVVFLADWLIERRMSVTNNEEYNRLLEKWRGADPATNPECEECGCDLTGKDVYGGKYGWYCMGCGPSVEKDINSNSTMSDYEERMWERRQMGLIDF